jgi:hypothetical protein
MTRLPIMTLTFRDRASRAFAMAMLCCGSVLAGALHAQVPAPTPPPAPAPAPAAAAPAKTAGPALELTSLSWLEGCWRGEVSQYEFREHWLPLRGGLMVGAGHVVFQGKTQDYGYLRLETRADGVYYVSISSARKEAAFKLTANSVDDKDAIFTFTNSVDEFPQRVVYRRGSEGWLYATVEGKVNGEDKQVIYPMRRVDCKSGAVIRN